MMNRLVLFLFTLCFFGEGYGLPSCPQNQNVVWDNCYGTYTYANGDRYVGEYKDDKRHGQGTYTYADGRVEEGLWEKGEFVSESTGDKGTDEKENESAFNAVIFILLLVALFIFAALKGKKNGTSGDSVKTQGSDSDTKIPPTPKDDLKGKTNLMYAKSPKKEEDGEIERELRKIEEMYEKSLITDEERQRMRNKVLGL